MKKPWSDRRRCVLAAAPGRRDRMPVRRWGRLPAWTALLALWLCVGMAESMKAAEDYDSVYERATRSFRSGNFPEAVKLYKKASAMRNHADMQSLWGLAQTYSRMGAHKNAVEACDQLIQAAEKEPEYLIKAWNARGSSYVAMGLASDTEKKTERLQQAERSFREVLRLSPQTGMGHYNLGLALIWLGRVEEGLGELRAFISSGEEGAAVQKARKIIENPRRAADNFAPDFAGVTSEGEYITSEDLRGKVVLLDFWGVWCVPCRNAVPFLAGLHKKFSGKPFVLVSVDVNDEEATWREYIAKNKMSWMHVRDDNRRIQQTYGVNAFPTYILIDHEGIILNRALGAGIQTEDTVQSAVKKAMKALAARPSDRSAAPESSPSSPVAVPEHGQPDVQTSAIPTPRLTVRASQVFHVPDALSQNVCAYAVQVKNWDSMPGWLFAPTKNLPPCDQGGMPMSPMAAEPDGLSSRMELQVLNERGESLRTFCGVSMPEMLQNVSVIFSKALRTDKIRMVLKDRLHGNSVQSEPVLLPTAP